MSRASNHWPAPIGHKQSAATGCLQAVHRTRRIQLGAAAQVRVRHRHAALPKLQPGWRCAPCRHGADEVRVNPGAEAERAACEQAMTCRVGTTRRYGHHIRVRQAAAGRSRGPSWALSRAVKSPIIGPTFVRRQRLDARQGRNVDVRQSWSGHAARRSEIR